MDLENRLNIPSRQRTVMAVIVWYLNLQIPMQSVPITTEVVSANPAHGKMHPIQHYVIKFVRDLWQVSAFLWVLQFPPPIKLTTMIYLKYYWKWR